MRAGNLKWFCICQQAYVTLCEESLFQAILSASAFDNPGHIWCRLNSDTVLSKSNILFASCRVRSGSACWEPWRRAEVCQHDACKSQLINHTHLRWTLYDKHSSMLLDFTGFSMTEDNIPTAWHRLLIVCHNGQLEIGTCNRLWKWAGYEPSFVCIAATCNSLSQHVHHIFQFRHQMIQHYSALVLLGLCQHSALLLGLVLTEVVLVWCKILNRWPCNCQVLST